jgi:hypothetical protein
VQPIGKKEIIDSKVRKMIFLFMKNSTMAKKLSYGTLFLNLKTQAFNMVINQGERKNQMRNRSMF